ncbi:MAG TPA: hypothetical protein H9796_13975 [Candidatus Butyricimonas faecavium]|nr:hypothetical protein [Candidatus Butyricimonas faecavium]
MILISRWRSPAVAEHILVVDITYVYLASVYEDQYGTEDELVVNPNIPGGKKMVDEDKDYIINIVCCLC